MKDFLLGTLVIIAGLIAGAAGARAETGRGITVQINQDFIAGGKAFSAGTYKLYPGSPATGQWLILRSKETGASVVLLPSTYDGTFRRQVEAKLKRAGNAYYLSEVATTLGVYTFPAARALPQTSKNKNHENMAVSGSDKTESGPLTD